MPRAPSGPLAVFYGDDFTGSTDALGQYARYGWRSVLLLSTDALAMLDDGAAGYDVVGIAGVTRTMRGAEFDREVEGGLRALAALRPRLVQYKICSTFDSSPAVGSIGRAAELGRSVFGADAVPVLPAQPEFGRYTVFGTHFAAFGEDVVRLDRHPSMSVHPVTPMAEADLRRHLEQQTDLRVGTLDIRAVQGPTEALHARVDAWNGSADVVVLDALTNEDLRRCGRAIMDRRLDGPRFVIGSGGLSYGVAGFLGEEPREPLDDCRAERSPLEQMLVLSGSCAVQTGAQIRWVLERGWAGVHLPIGELLSEPAATIETLRANTIAALQQGRSVVVYTAIGPGDAGAAADGAAQREGLRAGDLDRALGRAFAAVLDATRERCRLPRVLIAGGDTCGYTVGQIDAWGLEVCGQVVPAGFLCRLRSRSPRWDGLEILLKGGQVGGVAMFEQFRDASW
ncbi:MAG: type effector Hrp-dependent outer [Solirubrobacterales bacterium]|nr:type effector Hrp-dependent outer [Solirubrobacterales bacterium]